jgi:hypothetical protein
MKKVAVVLALARNFIIPLVPLCLASAILYGCATASGGHHVDNAAIDKLPGDRLVVPGRRVGQIYLGQSIDEVVNRLGPPDSAGTKVYKWGNGDVDCIWKGWRHGISVSYRADDARARISAIWVESPKWRTATDLGIDTPFKYALDKINETTVKGYGTYCDGACITFDSDGLELNAASRDSTLRTMVVYDPDKFSDYNCSGGHPPRN